MHFDTTITLGNVLTIFVCIASVLGVFARIDWLFRTFLFEHEMLVDWYCREHHINRADLPSRSRMR